MYILAFVGSLAVMMLFIWGMMSKKPSTAGQISHKDKEALETYKHTINRIDDWFEYSNESKKDREFIHKQLDALTKRLGRIYHVV